MCAGHICRNLRDHRLRGVRRADGVRDVLHLLDAADGCELSCCGTLGTNASSTLLFHIPVAADVASRWLAKNIWSTGSINPTSQCDQVSSGCSVRDR